MPKPANDNFPRKPRTPVFPPGLSRSARVATRFIPWLGLAGLGYELWRFHNGRSGEGQVGPFLPGWTVQQNCGGPPTHWFSGGNFGSPWPSVPCFGNSLSSSAQPINVPIPVTVRRLRLQEFVGRQSTSPFNPLYRAVQYQWRATNPAAPVQAYRPVMLRPQPARPVLDPHLLPQKMPMQMPVPLPWPVVAQLVNTDLPGRDAGPAPAPRQFPAGRTPPRKGEDEKKLRLPRAVRAAQWVSHQVTEGLDLLDAAHKALPKHLRAKPEFRNAKWYPPTPQDKAAAIFANKDQLNMADLGMNLLKNEIEDRVLGRANARVDRGLNNTPIGRITRGVAF